VLDQEAPCAIRPITATTRFPWVWSGGGERTHLAERRFEGFSRFCRGVYRRSAACRSSDCRTGNAVAMCLIATARVMRGGVISSRRVSQAWTRVPAGVAIVDERHVSGTGGILRDDGTAAGRETPTHTMWTRPGIDGDGIREHLVVVEFRTRGDGWRLQRLTGLRTLARVQVADGLIPLVPIRRPGSDGAKIFGPSVRCRTEFGVSVVEIHARYLSRWVTSPT
jgi:hypothetical protein